MKVFAWLCGIVFMVGGFMVQPRSQAPAFFAVGVLCIVIAIIITVSSKKPTKVETITSKPVDKWTDSERQYMLGQVESLHRSGQLTTLQYDVLKSKYTGTKSMAETLGLDVAVAASNKLDIERSIDAHNKQVNKNIIKSAAIGSAIGGLGGEIVGIATAANKGAQERQKLANDLENANRALDEAIKRKVNR